MKVPCPQLPWERILLAKHPRKLGGVGVRLWCPPLPAVSLWEPWRQR